MNEAAPVPVRPDIDALIQQALAHVGRNDLYQAEQALLESLAIVPEDATAVQLLGVVRRMQGRSRRCITIWETS
jgi:hypothetical protein